MVGQILYLPPSTIHFTQDSISDEFGAETDQRLEDTFRDLLYGVITVDQDIPHIHVVRDDEGKYWAETGNRRLYVFRRLQIHHFLDVVPVVEQRFNQQKFERKLTSINDGVKVKIRADHRHPNGDKLANRLDKIYSQWVRDGRRCWNDRTNNNPDMRNMQDCSHGRTQDQSSRVNNSGRNKLNQVIWVDDPSWVSVHDFDAGRPISWNDQSDTSVQNAKSYNRKGDSYVVSIPVSSSRSTQVTQPLPSTRGEAQTTIQVVPPLPPPRRGVQTVALCSRNVPSSIKKKKACCCTIL